MIQIERILCPVDYSPDSEGTNLADQAMRYAIALARTYGAKLHVVYCSEGLLDVIERERLTRRYEAAIQADRGIGRSAPADRNFFILAGPPEEEIPSFAAQQRIDLIVLGSRRRSLSTTLLGSTAEAISRAAPCPVLVVHSQEREFIGSTTCELDLNRILVAHDFSNDSELALRYGQSLAQERQAELHVLHALPYAMAPAFIETPLDIEDGFQRAARLLRDSVQSEAYLWCKVKNAVRVGPAYREILSYAEDESINHEIYRRRVRRVLFITLALNLLVVAGKLIAGLLAGAMSVISDAIHSSVDSLNNIVGLAVMRYSTAAPDEEHPYGHGKFETLAAFVIAGFLFVTCYQISLSALKRLFVQGVTSPEITGLTFGVMISTILSNIAVTLYERREGRRLQSAFLIADSAHTRSDVLVSCSVLSGLILMRIGYAWIDPIISLVVAMVIAWSGYQIFKSTAPILVDAAPVPAQRIAEIVQSIPGVHSAHDIRSRSLGGGMYVEMHLHLTKDFERNHIVSHAITEEIEKKLKTTFGQVTATIHVEPSPED